MDNKDAVRSATQIGDMFNSPGGEIFQKWLIDQVELWLQEIARVSDPMEVMKLTGKIALAQSILEYRDMKISAGRMAMRDMQNQRQEFLEAQEQNAASRSRKSSYERSAI